ncbi:MAG: hypothetical protein EXR93_01530 [Gemmatimonadetes bacterium]|nr:hypothetical protein [Gemmatimonadota bacterium]
MLIRRRGRTAALAFLDTVYAERMHDIRFVDREMESAAVDRWIRPFRNQGFSLADAVSFEIMRREGIRTAFALDRHFAAAGFDLLPE